MGYGSAGEIRGRIQSNDLWSNLQDKRVNFIKSN